MQTEIRTAEIRTERLVLRPFAPDDAKALRALADNWNIARMLSRMPYPYTEDAAELWIATHDAMRAEGREFPLAVTANGSLVGATGAMVQDNGTHEIGYWIGEPYWNRGYATEAARAAIGFARERLGARSVVAGHFAENHASGRVLTKLGFRYTGEEYRWCEARQRTLLSLAMRLEETAVSRMAVETAQ